MHRGRYGAPRMGTVRLRFVFSLAQQEYMCYRYTFLVSDDLQR